MLSDTEQADEEKPLRGKKKKGLKSHASHTAEAPSKGARTRISHPAQDPIDQQASVDVKVCSHWPHVLRMRRFVSNDRLSIFELLANDRDGVQLPHLLTSPASRLREDASQDGDLCVFGEPPER